MPSSRRPTSPSNPTPSPRAPQPEYSGRVRAHSTRPEKYSVPHLPRHVVAANQGDETSSPRREAKPKRQVNSERAAKVQRRLRFKRRLTLWELGGFAVSGLACVFLLGKIGGAQKDMRQEMAQVHEKQTQFRALDKQRNDEKNRLAYLKSEKGRDQLLAERGFLPPGDRILLFPADEKVGDVKQP